MTTTRVRPRLATVLAVALIGAVSFGISSAGSAGADKPKPPPVTTGDQPIATMTIRPATGQPYNIDVHSLQLGVGIGVSSPRGGPRTISEPSVSEITVSRKTDSTSPILFGYITRATILPEVELTGSLPDGTAFAYELTDVIVSGLSESAGSNQFSESLSLNFTKIRTTVGANTAAYDLTTATAP